MVEVRPGAAGSPNLKSPPQHGCAPPPLDVAVAWCSSGPPSLQWVLLSRRMDRRRWLQNLREEEEEVKEMELKFD